MSGTVKVLNSTYDRRNMNKILICRNCNKELVSGIDKIVSKICNGSKIKHYCYSCSMVLNIL